MSRSPQPGERSASPRPNPLPPFDQRRSDALVRLSCARQFTTSPNLLQFTKAEQRLAQTLVRQRKHEKAVNHVRESWDRHQNVVARSVSNSRDGAQRALSIDEKGWIKDAVMRTSSAERRESHYTDFREKEKARQQSVKERNEQSLWNQAQLQSQRREIMEWEGDLHSHALEVESVRCQLQRQEAIRRHMSQTNEKKSIQEEAERKERQRCRQQFLDQLRAKLDQQRREEKQRFRRQVTAHSDMIATAKAKETLQSKMLQQDKAVVRRNFSETKKMKQEMERELVVQRRSASTCGGDTARSSRSVSTSLRSGPMPTPMENNTYLRLLGRRQRILCAPDPEIQRSRSAEPISRQLMEARVATSPIARKHTTDMLRGRSGSVSPMRRHLLEWR